MTHHDKHGEEEKEQQATAQNDMTQRQEPEPTTKPSQAEGDRQTIDESISQKENKGEL